MKTKIMEKIRMALRFQCMYLRVILVGVLIGVMVFCQGCDNLKDPPISVTFRESLLKGAVLQLHNRSNGRVVCAVYVRNSSKDQSKCSDFGIPPNGMVEVGLLEMEWAFEEGEVGYVAVDGYWRKIYFELKKGTYHTHIGF